MMIVFPDPFRKPFGHMIQTGTANEFHDRQVDPQSRLNPISQLHGHQGVQSEVEKRHGAVQSITLDAQYLGYFFTQHVAQGIGALGTGQLT